MGFPACFTLMAVPRRKGPTQSMIAFVPAGCPTGLSEPIAAAMTRTKRKLFAKYRVATTMPLNTIMPPAIRRTPKRSISHPNPELVTVAAANIVPVTMPT